MTYNLYALLYANNTQKLSLIRPVMLIRVLYKNVLDLTCNALCTYFERSKINLTVVKHLFSRRCCYSNLGQFSPWYSKLTEHVHSHYHLYLLCSACCKMHFSVEALPLQICPSHPHIHMDTHLFESSSEIFHHRPNTCQCGQSSFPAAFFLDL